LVISDDNKPLLMANPAFFSYLVDALLLVREHCDLLMKCVLFSCLHECMPTLCIHTNVLCDAVRIRITHERV
jgi:hypothetical protein